jgi:hypothetical protein
MFALQKIYGTDSQYSVAAADVNGDSKPWHCRKPWFEHRQCASQLSNGIYESNNLCSWQLSISVAAADVNGDKPDIICRKLWFEHRQLCFSTRATAFADQTTYAAGSCPISVAAADVNGDNKPDIIVANSGSRAPSSVLLNA